VINVFSEEGIDHYAVAMEDREGTSSTSTDGNLSQRRRTGGPATCACAAELAVAVGLRCCWLALAS
jgi:hypothetical protein